MVTEIIKQEDVHTSYMNIHNWIRYGISEDAIALCRDRWNKTIDVINYSNSYTVRNKIFMDDTYINKLNKW